MSEFEANNLLSVKQVNLDNGELYNFRKPERITTEKAEQRTEVQAGDLNDSSTWALV